MSFDLVGDVFEPVFQRLESEIDYLSDWIPQRRGSQRGLEDRWFQPVVVTPTLKARGYEIEEYVCGDAPGQKGKVDLLLRHANSELQLELKAANDFRIGYVVGTEKDGWIPTHLERTHDITAGDYREKYGLPWRRGLCGIGTSKKLSKNMLDRQKKGFRPPIETAWKKSVGATKRQDQPFFVKVKADNMKIGSEKFKKYAEKGYRKVLTKILREKKGLNEACKDAGMPHFRAVSKYAKKNADFRKRLERTYEQLPYREAVSFVKILNEVRILSICHRLM